MLCSRREGKKMAVTDSALCADLADLYRDMASSPMSVEDYADRMAQAVSGQIRTASVPAGTVLVSATGGVSNPAPINVV